MHEKTAKPSEPSDQYSAEEIEQRVHATLRGAFRGSPTQLKSIPRKPRVSRVKKTAFGASVKNARRAP